MQLTKSVGRCRQMKKSSAEHLARSQVASLELLLQQPECRVLFNVANSTLTTPLMPAAQEGHGAVCTLLLQHGAKVNRRNHANLTALMLAAQQGHAPIAQLLIDHGAQVDARTSHESTSLLLVCKRGNMSVVQVLVTA